MKKLILSCVLFISVFNLFAINDLRVGDPRNSWQTYKGTIDEAMLTVRPKGLFMEYGLYLTFSSKGTIWTNANDTLEVTLKFDLPENAIITDSWLWIGNDIIKAKLLDKWSASAIYENIVKRRRDPSILSKQSATQYELRVFPMAGNETRKVKITYLMPTTWSKTNVFSAVPTAILNTSNTKPVSFPILTWPDTIWTNPKIINDLSLSFTTKTDTIFGTYQLTTIPSTKYSANIGIGFDTPAVNGLYFSGYQNGNEGIYQLALFPDQFFEADVIKKAAVLIDYDASNTNVTVKELLNSVKNEMLVSLNSKDSFNLIFSNLSITRYSKKWVAASKTNIEAAFNSLDNPLSSYSNLGALLGNGIDFVKNNGKEGKIILISDGDQFGDFQVANTLINDVIKLMNPKLPVHISDYQSISFPSYFKDGLTYYGNDYFYSNLSRMTLGSYHRVKNGLSLSETITGSLKYLGGSINSFDLHTSLKAGFCHSRYTLTGGVSNIAYVNDALLQVGKFKGEFPFRIEISGEYNNKVFSNTMEIQQPPVSNKDSVSEAIWSGQYIKKLESGNQSNDIINEIIFSSLSERILSKYTSFLCLEDTSLICANCTEQPQITFNVKEVTADRDLIKIYPNPFVEKLTIEITCDNPVEVKELYITDITGAIICRFAAVQLQKGKNIISWNGLNLNGERVKPGVYLLVFKTSGYSETIKILRK